MENIDMENRRKFSIFISSTYEDLKEERQALVGVALDSYFSACISKQYPTSRTDRMVKGALGVGVSQSLCKPSN